MEYDLDFLAEVFLTLSTLRLEAEGAISLFEDEVCMLSREMDKNQKRQAIIALDMIGSALYDFRTKITELQIAYAQGKGYQKPE